MAPDRTTLVPAVVSLPGGLPAFITSAGERASWRFVEFFTATIRNPNTREPMPAPSAAFWPGARAGDSGTSAPSRPVVVVAYIEQFPASKPTVKQHLAAIRQCLDYLVTGGILDTNPAASVRGPTYVIKKGKTPVLDTEQTRALLEAIDTDTIVGLHDRALIGVMVYSFARVSAVIGMRVQDYYPNGKRWWCRLHEKGGKFHEVPAHHNAEAYMDAYLDTAGIKNDPKGPLFRTINRLRSLTPNRMNRIDVSQMVKRRAREAGLPPNLCCHTFRATGITAYLENNGTIEKAQAIAAHESPRTTKLYDRTGDDITLDEIEKIAI